MASWPDRLNRLDESNRLTGDHGEKSPAMWWYEVRVWADNAGAIRMVVWATFALPLEDGKRNGVFGGDSERCFGRERLDTLCIG